MSSTHDFSSFPTKKLLLCLIWLCGWSIRQSVPPWPLCSLATMMLAWTLLSQSYYKINAFIHTFIYIFTQVLFCLPFTTDRLEDRKDVRCCNPICPALWIISMSASPLSVALRALSACKAEILQSFFVFFSLYSCQSRTGQTWCFL